MFSALSRIKVTSIDKWQYLHTRLW